MTEGASSGASAGLGPGAARGASPGACRSPGQKLNSYLCHATFANFADSACGRHHMSKLVHNHYQI